jgi:hypothetical protein
VSTLGLSFIRDGNSANAFSKLSRYETTMERDLYKALHELQRLQANRVAADSIPLPLMWTWTFLEFLRVTAEVWLCFAMTEHEHSSHNAPFVSEALVAEGCSTL